MVEHGDRLQEEVLSFISWFPGGLVPHTSRGWLRRCTSFLVPVRATGVGPVPLEENTIQQKPRQQRPGMGIASLNGSVWCSREDLSEGAGTGHRGW